MQKRNNKKWVRRIVMGIIIWMVMSMGLNAAFAINLQLKVDGACPGETVEVQGTGGSCGDPTSDEIKKCEGDIYIPTAETCPKEAGTDTGTSQTAQEAIAKLVAVIKAVEETLNKMLWPILFLIGGLLENDILFGGGMEQRLYDIWVPIRNIVNIIFVLTLVGLALYSVLGINSENSQYSIKTMLPKLIAGIIAVNFSFIGMKVFLDTVSVFTSAIFAIPAQIEETSAPVLGNDSDLKTQAFCREVYGISTKKGKSIKDFGAVLKDQALLELAKQYGIPTHFKIETIEDVGKSLPGGNGERFTAELDRLRNLGLCTVSSESSSSFELSEHGLQYFEKYRSSNAALAMAINMGEVMFYDGSGSALGSGSYESLAINAIFSLLLYIVYGISFGVLFIVLLARLIVLWLGIALSPIIALSIAVPVAKEKFKMGELTQKFVAHAIAPITIALSMTIGWIMLTAIKSTMSDGGFAMSGSILIPSLPIPGLETLQGLLVSIATVAVVWVGVFMAANETIAGTITEGIKSQVQRFGGWLATAPFKYTSWVPVETKDGTTTNLTPAGIMAAGQSLRSKIETAGTEKALKAFGIEKVNAGFDNIKPAMAADDLSETVQNTKLESDKKLTKEKLAALAGTSTINELDKMIEAGGKGGEFAELMKNAIEKSKKGDELSGTEIKALQNAASAYNKESG